MADFQSPYTMTIDGKAVRAERTLDVVNPATGEAFASCPAAGISELNSAVAAARRAFGPWKARPHAERQAILNQVADAISANAQPLASLFTLEQGRPTALAI